MIDSKQTFDSHLRSVAASASLRISILRKSRSVFRDRSIVFCCFWSFILPVLENCSPVWMFAAVFLCLIRSFRVHLVLVVVLFAVICGTETELPLCVCLFCLINDSAGHPQMFTAGRPTRHNLAMHSFTLVCPRCRTLQCSRTLFPACDQSDFL